MKTFGTKSRQITYHASIASEEQFAADMHALSGYCCSSAVLSSKLPHFFSLYIGLLGITQLTKKLQLALRLILRGSLGPTA